MKLPSFELRLSHAVRLMSWIVMTFIIVLSRAVADVFDADKVKWFYGCLLLGVLFSVYDILIVELDRLKRGGGK